MTYRTGLGFGLTAAALVVTGASTAWGQPAEVTSTEGEQGEVLHQEEDTIEKTSESSGRLPPRVPWRATISWQQTATTTALGIGRDNIGDSHEVYMMDWSLGLSYTVLDHDVAGSLSMFITPGFGVELTNSGWTTTEREPQFNDLPLGATYVKSLWSHDDIPLGIAASFSPVLVFPTSPASESIGTYLTTSLRPGVSLTIPLAYKAPVFKAMAAAFSFRWDHRFGAATTPVNDDLDRPRQTSTGDSFLSDQLSFDPLATNTVQESITIMFPQSFAGMDLAFGDGFTFTHAYLPEFEGSDCEVQLVTGCVKASSEEDVRTERNSIGFTAMLSFSPLPEAGFTLAYANSSTQLGPDGERRSIFYSPNAAFGANIWLSIDAIYEAATGPRRSGASTASSNNRDERQQRNRAITF